MLRLALDGASACIGATVEGGGGTGQESYELAAYFYARRVSMTSLDKGKKGFFFFLGDEGFYPQVDLAQVARILGHQAPEAAPEIGDHGQPFPGATHIDAARVFAELQEKFHTFLIFPQKSMAERKRDIDAEIKTRVIGRSKRTVVIADATKLGRADLARRTARAA